jgi:hypothetical protein
MERMTGLSRRLIRFAGLPAEERSVLLHSAALLALARTLLRTAGVSRARRAVARLSVRPRLEPSRLAEIVRMASAVLPGVTSCLPRALVLEGLLRAADHPAELRIGVAPRNGRPSLPAHAWVEVGGVAVAEDPSAYTALPVFGASA